MLDRVKITRLLGGVADWAGAGQGDCGGGAGIHNYINADKQKENNVWEPKNQKILKKGNDT